jgi:hypothetical protein
MKHHQVCRVKRDQDLAPDASHHLAIRTDCTITGLAASLAAALFVAESLEARVEYAIPQDISLRVETPNDVKTIIPRLVLCSMRERGAVSMPRAFFFIDGEYLAATALPIGRNVAQNESTSIRNCKCSGVELSQGGRVIGCITVSST